MKKTIQYFGFLFLLIAIATPQAPAQEESMKGMEMPKSAPSPVATPHEGMEMGKKSEEQKTAPMNEMEGMSMPPSPAASNPPLGMPGLMDLPIPKATSPVAYGLPPHLENGWHPPVMDQNINSYAVADKLEYGVGRGADLFIWDMQGWVGGDYDKFWWKTEGQQQTSRDLAGETEVQALYSRLITPFWFAQGGVRRDEAWGPGGEQGRTFAVLGLQGLSPYRFDLEPALFISEEGDVSASLTATYDILLTQRLILQPRLDFDAAVQSVEKFGVGEGVNSVGLGLRLRYEIRREFAPYVGVEWLQQFDETAKFSRNNRERTEDLRFVFGVRLWY
ncbi:MAG: copper resistance protein B [Verrucomicrobiota bacterium]